VPEISRFFGIVIAINYNDHQPPHFHARYGEYKALIAIPTLTLLRGRLPARALGLTIEWASRHQDELMDNWERARHHEPLIRIEPLE